MKIMQEENIQHVEHQLEKRYQLDAYSCMFFVLGMMISAYFLHQFILYLISRRSPIQKANFVGFFMSKNICYAVSLDHSLHVLR